jgi:hypothetical protein
MSIQQRAAEKSESMIRFEVRMLWREEGRLDGYKQYPLGSSERSIAIDEAQKIAFEHEMSA